MRKFIALLFIGALSLAGLASAMTGAGEKKPKKTYTKQTKRSKKGKYARRFGKTKIFKGKITSVSIKALDPNKAGEEVMGWLNPEACGATGTEKCAIVNDPQGTHFVKEVSARGRKGFGYIGDAESTKRQISGKVLRVYKKTGSERSMAASESSKAYQAKGTKRKSARSTKSGKKSHLRKTAEYRKKTKSGGGRMY